MVSGHLINTDGRLVDVQFNEEPVERVEQVEAPTRTVDIHIPCINTLLAEGVWVHNDLPATAAASSGSGSGISVSASGSGSGSSSGPASASAPSSGPGFSATASSQSVALTEVSGPGQTVKK